MADGRDMAQGEDAWRDGAGEDSLALRPAPPLPRRPAPPARRTAPPIAGIERRLAALATEAWAAGGGAYVGGFDVNTVLIADPAGLALVEEVGDTIAARFGIVPGLALARLAGGHGPGLASELAAACDLISLAPTPLPFETSLAGHDGALLMVRGVALPLIAGADAGKVQAIVNWRQVLDRTASRRLREELGLALTMVRGSRMQPRPDPFAPFLPGNEAFSPAIARI